MRARGFTAGGYFNGSGGCIETVAGSPIIVSQPASRTAAPGETALFTVGAGGSAPLRYQWKKAGVSIPGATTSSFAIQNLQFSDAVSYSVSVSNASGSVIRAV